MTKKILVVDDATFMRAMLKYMLTSSGYEIVAEATNGEEAVDLFIQFKPAWLQWPLQCQRWTG